MKRWGLDRNDADDRVSLHSLIEKRVLPDRHPQEQDEIGEKGEKIKG